MDPEKLQSHWEHVIHVVVVQSPLYKVKLQSGGGRTRVVHRNLLLPRDALELDASNPALGTRPRKIAAEGPLLSVSGNGLLSSAEEVSVDLVNKIPSEEGVSESVSPDQDLPSDSIEDYVVTEGTNGTSDEMEYANEGVLKMMKLNHKGRRTTLSRRCQLGRSTKEDLRRS